MKDANTFNSMLSFINQIEKRGLTFDHAIKIHFLRNFTIEPIEPFLKFYLYQVGIHPIISYSNYNSIEQEILVDESYLLSKKPEIVVLSLLNYTDDLFFCDLERLEEIKGMLKMTFDQLAEKTQALILVNTFIPPFYSSLLSVVDKTPGTSYFYAAINSFIREYIVKCNSKFILMDWERYFRLLGENSSMDYRYWYLNKAPFKKEFLDCYAKDIERIVKVIFGKIKKCLVLDCDNTLWGGIIGEDGFDNIKLDNYTYPGKIFYDFHQSVLNLYDQGVIIVLCSKNNEEDVWQVFDAHPACLIKRMHIAAHRINWKDKVTNIIELSEELNLGLDSFVFIDDSAIECELVKKFLPDITVIQVPENLYLYPQIILRETLFDTLSINQDDKKRVLRYQQESVRRGSAKKFLNIEDYLCDLQLEVNIHPVKENEISRVAQLTQKTNQFNLSVKRYTDSDIKRFCLSENSGVFSLLAKDRYGDYGLTGVLIAKRFKNSIEIDSLLLSCRVLSRRIEHVFLYYCFQHLRQKWGLEYFYANFTHTNKNDQVKHFLDAVGFNLKEKIKNICVYTLDKAPKTPRIDFIQVQLENCQ